MSFAERAARRTDAPRILCAGIIVLDEVFRVDEFPQPDGKVQANGFFVVNGGCAANAAVAIARLGGRAALAGPMGGPAGEDDNGDRVLKALTREQVDCSFCQRIDGLSTALSAIFMNARGDRTIVTYRDERIAATVPADAAAIVATADAVLVDNRYPDFVLPICAAARARGIPVVVDGDRPTVEDDPLFRLPAISFFPPNACARQPASPISARVCNASRAIPAPFSQSATAPTTFSIAMAARCAACRCSRSPPSIRSAPATPFTAVSCWRWPKAEARSTPCGSAPPSPASNARGSAARSGAPTRARSRGVIGGKPASTGLRGAQGRSITILGGCLGSWPSGCRKGGPMQQIFLEMRCGGPRHRRSHRGFERGPGASSCQKMARRLAARRHFTLRLQLLPGDGIFTLRQLLPGRAVCAPPPLSRPRLSATLIFPAFPPKRDLGCSRPGGVPLDLEYFSLYDALSLNY